MHTGVSCTVVIGKIHAFHRHTVSLFSWFAPRSTGLVFKNSYVNMQFDPECPRMCCISSPAGIIAFIHDWVFGKVNGFHC